MDPQPLSMRIELLGSGRVLHSDGRELLRSGIPLTLLAYLQTSLGPVSRDHLAMLFWPGRPRARALQSLRQTLSRLRSAVGNEILVSEGRDLSLGRSSISVDVDDLYEFCRQGEAERALSLWRGIFLQDFRLPESWELEDWLEQQRARLVAAVTATVSTELRSLLEAGNIQSGVSLGTRAMESLGFQAPVVEAYFIALLENGDRTEAAALLSDCHSQGEAALARELAPLLELESILLEPEVQATPREPSHDGLASESEPAPISGSDPLRFRSAGGRALPSRRGTGVSAVVITFLFAMGALGAFRSLGVALAGPGLNPPSDRIAVFCSEVATEGQGGQLFRMTLDGLNKHRITSRLGCEVAWLAGPGVLVMRENSPEGPRAVLLRPDSGNSLAEWRSAELTSTRVLVEIGFAAGHLSVVDDSRLLLAGREEGETLSIYLLDPLADRLDRLTDNMGQELHPAWNPTRSEVLFSSDRGGSRSLWSVSLAEGLGEPQRLTSSPSQDTRPIPHEDKLLFVRGFGEGRFDGDMEIRLLDRSTGEDLPLISRPWNDLDPVWAPDGERFCWQSEEFGHFESHIQVMEIASGRRWLVTEGRPGRHSNCNWTSDGAHLLFRSNSGEGIPQVVISDPHGRVIHDLTRTPFASYPGVEISRKAVGGATSH